MRYSVFVNSQERIIFGIRYSVKITIRGNSDSLQELLHEDESFKYYKVPMEKGTLMTKDNVIAACKNANMQVPCPSPKACCPPGHSPYRNQCKGSGNFFDCVSTPLMECDNENNNPYLPEGRCRQFRCGHTTALWCVKIVFLLSTDFMEFYISGRL